MWQGLWKIRDFGSKPTIINFTDASLAEELNCYYVHFENDGAVYLSISAAVDIGPVRNGSRMAAQMALQTMC